MTTRVALVSHCPLNQNANMQSAPVRCFGSPAIYPRLVI